METYYRIKGQATFDGEAIFIDSFPVLRHTPKGVWVQASWREEKFIAHSWRKKWAHPTVEEAIESFRRRQLRRIEILEAQLNATRIRLDIIKQIHAEGITDPLKINRRNYKNTSLFNFLED